ncbi:DUF6152 family protein [Sphingosinicella sp. BN140058]|uniref:DUF6152 family protein n=1 Tax=Sphingosinicella sp. BN140058 TaxID=1892855 RepID=UPI0010129848|nr:DUF6152 family protein [Sphingosinicella sp. BN140058]QAY78742.1 hypothetical protein ETR14_21010 [Sphingosinicella sp. BN140058]
MKPIAFAVATLLSVTAVVASAHHGWSSYDETKPITLTGSLKDVSWSNPHGTARMRWQGQDWDVVLAPVARMESRGLSNAMLSGGKKVTITGYARRDGIRELRLERIRVGDRMVELR